MCIIIDANIAPSLFKNPYNNKDAIPIIKWCENKDGCIVIGGKLSDELFQCQRTREFLFQYSKMGFVYQANNEKIFQEEKKIKSLKIKSNDTHILALARITNSRILFTKDVMLKDDFKNLLIIQKPKGKIYKRKDHKKLLKHNKKCKKNRK